MAATEQARVVLEQAKAEADQILSNAHSAASEVKLQAEAIGRAKAVADLAAERIAHQERLNKTSEEQLDRSIDLAKLLAERMIGEALRLDPELIARLAKGALQHMQARGNLTVRVNPDDRAVVEQQLHSLSLKSVTLSSAAELGRGELCIDSDAGRLETRLEPGLSRLVDRLRSLLRDDR